MPVHVNLTVADTDRSLAFYRRWLGFGQETREFADGTVFIRDDEGTDLAFHAGLGEHRPSRLFHFGFRRHDPGAVRALGSALVAAGVDVFERDDDAEIVNVKFLDPDGYFVEVYWEPE
ncbi:MAG: VOC family protein [Acidimicrobiales bacterium]